MHLFTSPAFRHFNRSAAITTDEEHVLLLFILLALSKHGPYDTFNALYLKNTDILERLPAWH